MGLFDTVTFNCDNCGKKLEIKTKAGGCALDTYPISQLASKPIKDRLSILDDISREKIHCPSCGYVNQINLIVSPSIRINSWKE